MSLPFRLWCSLMGRDPELERLRRLYKRLRPQLESLETNMNEYVRSHKELQRLLEEGIATLEAGLVEV